ncbi:hypothetical protein AAFF_G00169370 [Aldrovandia affinis]|uniref:Uncharacterized protein n=1 Tax=Aldrovandia affinis TaxID=143900 RepID=A0AAD7RM40_9TELE|nr:hypothetical protein AAFF_G00169370 [Aldrovandia affinis]
MDSPWVLRGSWVVLLLLFSCVPLEGHPQTFEEPYVPFPPARPSMVNLDNICVNEPHRPLYPLDSLPRTGYSYLRRQGDAINGMESAYQECCKLYGYQWLVLTLSCVQKAWKGGLSKYCVDEFSVKTKPHPCCMVEEDMHNCFATKAPNKSYTPTPTKK